ncbi:MAG: hypothetical protein P4L79_06390 [Legionella sp.]|uniref:hypothetical protein n=1 Tax=Legionella sp. TaxID=459 RepID=UPI00283E413C|nr:hypothetical protein [Legionella sp.]
MKERLVHQWRDWLLKYTGDDTYELINKNILLIQKITAKDSMDAETKIQLIIKNEKEEQTISLQNVSTSYSAEESVTKT